ncbi:hypothetical protein NSTCB13_00328 [Nostoc sp. DSM 114160]|jgi:hypothetical protein
MSENNIQKYRFVCTLTFGDIYGQIIVWLITITLSLASALALMGAKRPVYALATAGSRCSAIATFLVVRVCHYLVKSY